RATLMSEVMSIFALTPPADWESGRWGFFLSGESPSSDSAVVHAHHAGALHGRVLQQRLLRLLGTDVEAVVDDDLLLATAEPEVAVRIGLHHVAVIQPPVPDRRLGRRLIVPVTDRVGRRLDPETPFLARRQQAPRGLFRV